MDEMSPNLVVLILILIMAPAAVLSVIVYVKVQRGEWLSGLRLERRESSAEEKRKKQPR